MTTYTPSDEVAGYFEIIEHLEAVKTLLDTRRADVGAEIYALGERIKTLCGEQIIREMRDSG